MLNVGEKVKYYRKIRNLSQKQLSEMINVSESQLKKYENGITKITVDMLYEISNVLDVPIYNFLLTPSDNIVDIFKELYNIDQNDETNLTEDIQTLLDFLKHKYDK